MVQRPIKSLVSTIRLVTERTESESMVTRISSCYSENKCRMIPDTCQIDRWRSNALWHDDGLVLLMARVYFSEVPSLPIKREISRFSGPKNHWNFAISRFSNDTRHVKRMALPLFAQIFTNPSRFQCSATWRLWLLIIYSFDMQFHKKNIKVMNYAKNTPHVLSWGVLKV